MVRDWEVIRKVLVEVESHDLGADGSAGFHLDLDKPFADQPEAHHAFMLFDADFIKGIDASSDDGKVLLSPELTWRGHELLDTIRSKPIWEKTKQLAQEKGVSLTLDSVMALGKVAWSRVVDGT